MSALQKAAAALLDEMERALASGPDPTTLGLVGRARYNYLKDALISPPFDSLREALGRERWR